MPKFLYKAKKGPTETIEGEIDAENEEAALGKISGQGLVPIRIVSASGAPPPARVEKRALEARPAAAEVKPVAIDKAKARISHKDLNIFTRQFAILLRASVPLLKIIEILQIQSQNAKFRQILHQIEEGLREGDSLSAVLARYPRIFNQLFVNMVNSGEISGALDKVLVQLADFSEKEAEVRSKVQAAMIYPLFLLLVGIGTIFILLTFVMPRLMTLFADLGTELPTITRVIIRVSEFCQSYWMIMLGAALFIGIFLRSAGLSEKQRRMIDRTVLKLPLFGNLVKKAETAKFLRSLELLYENGIPLYQAVAIAAKTVTSIPLREDLAKVPERLEGGMTLAKSLEQIPYLSAFVTNMVSVGEESGQLGTAVRETASFFEAETNQFIKIATSLIEPALILTIGLVIGMLVIGMLLPIFEIHVMAN
jgi:type II secretory pathway component PulF